MPTYKLSYFDANARAEVARLILAVSHVDYEDHRFKFEDWPSIKPGQLLLDLYTILNSLQITEL